MCCVVSCFCFVFGVSKICNSWPDHFSALIFKPVVFVLRGTSLFIGLHWHTCNFEYFNAVSLVKFWVELVKILEGHLIVPPWRRFSLWVQFDDALPVQHFNFSSQSSNGAALNFKQTELSGFLFANPCHQHWHFSYLIGVLCIWRLWVCKISLHSATLTWQVLVKSTHGF